MYSFNELKRFAKGNNISNKSIKIALLADTASQFIHTALKGFGAAHQANYTIWEADYDQIDRQVFDPTSELYEFAPDFVVILRSSEHLLNSFYKTGSPATFAAEQTNYLHSIYEQVTTQIKCKVITNTYFEINDSVFGNYAGKTTNSFIYQIRKLNVQLMDLAQEKKNLFLFDFDLLVGQMGYAQTFDTKLYINGDMVYSLDVLPYLASNLHDIIQSINGKFKKCLVIDLDNTMWGGIIGDDGMGGIKIGHLGIGKAFTQMQLWFKQLKNRGIILAICSKNTEDIAKEPFEKHPDMVLRLEDIAVFVANWENKVDNIRYIQGILNIGFDSMVFLDDNPFERGMVKQGIPELTVPELPEDPADYLQYLRSLNLFETASYTAEDSVRTKQYQEEAQRAILQKSFTNETEFLQSLEMKSDVEAFNDFTIPRVAQLSQRSNQFNLRTQRYTEAEITDMLNDGKHLTFSFTLEDKFGDHGLISALILTKEGNETLFIDTWIMSCRVLKRGMEQFTLYCLAKKALEQGFTKLVGEYLPTSKNGIVKDHYKDLGFTQSGDKWVLQLDKDKLTNNSLIQIKNNG